MFAVLVIALYIVSGILAYGLTYAEFARKYPNVHELEYDEDKKLARVMALLGFIGLGVFMSCGEYRGILYPFMEDGNGII